MPPEQKEFHLHEYSKLSAEVSWMLCSTSSIIQYTVLVAASVFAWLSTQVIGLSDNGFCYKIPNEIASFAWYIPFIVTILAGLIVVQRKYILMIMVST